MLIRRVPVLKPRAWFKYTLALVALSFVFARARWNSFPSPAVTASRRAAIEPPCAECGDRSYSTATRGDLGRSNTYETCETCAACVFPGDAQDLALELATASGRATCATCTGCDLALERVNKHDEKIYSGNSGAFVARGRTGRGEVVAVKAHCGVRGGYRQVEKRDEVPFECVDDDEEYVCPMNYPSVGHGRCNRAHMRAVYAVVRDMGFEDLLPRTKSTMVKTFLPWDGSSTAGLKQFFPAIELTDWARGVSIGEAGRDGVVTMDLFKLIKAMNASDYAAMTLMDVALGARDRHPLNIFIATDGRLTLIDNEDVFSENLDAVQIPGTTHNWFSVAGYANKTCRGARATEPTTQCVRDLALVPRSIGVVLDYRCWVNGGEIGFDYPPKFKAFLKNVAEASAEATRAKYALAHPSHADFLKRRAHSLLTRGFELTLKHALATAVDEQYDITPPCCSTFACALPTSNDFIDGFARAGFTADDATVGVGGALSDVALAMVGENTVHAVERVERLVFARLRTALDSRAEPSA